MAKYREEDLAYDGSSLPQRRELTPRERDIVCRVLSDILHVAWAHGGSVISTHVFDKVRIRVSEPEFLSVISEARKVLTPRED